jgi:hypothetical protein
MHIMAHPSHFLADAHAQRFIVLMSLDSLQGVWKDLNLDIESIDGMMRAARQTILRTKPTADAPRPEVATDFLATLESFCGTSAAKSLQVWLETLDGRPHDQSFRYWNGWLSQYQHKQAIPGLDTEWTRQLLPAYRRAVVLPRQAFSLHLKEKVLPIWLSDWDLHIHAAFNICYFATGRFASSVAFTELELEKGNRLSIAFIKEWAQKLPPRFQNDLRAQVVKEICEREAFLGDKARLPWEKPFEPASVLQMGEI